MDVDQKWRLLRDLSTCLRTYDFLWPGGAVAIAIWLSLTRPVGKRIAEGTKALIAAFVLLGLVSIVAKIFLNAGFASIPIQDRHRLQSNTLTPP